MPGKTRVEQLRAATRLTVEATQSVTEIVEAMHQTIASGPQVLGKPFAPIATALTAPIYSAVRGITGLVGQGLDAALARLTPLLGESKNDEHLALLSALNGVLGDYLVETANPLAIEMQLFRDGVALAPAAFGQVDGHVLLLVHGSSMNEAQWLRGGHNHGLALAEALGATALFLRYNSGLHVSENGTQLAELLERIPMKRLTVVGHSMGGLVARSAFAHAEAADLSWRKKTATLVTLGTPHHGSPVERLGNWADLLLSVSRYSAPLARLGQLRSAGVTDLRYGNVVEADWQHDDRFAFKGDQRTAVPLPEGVRCFAIAASTDAAPSDAPAGDGLVPVESALGRHERLGLHFTETWVAYGTNHLELLSSHAVYEKIREFIG